jgi:agmatine/peptidylarginine deiminase
MTKQLLPEWVPLDAVILAWPDDKTDWRPFLAEAQATYIALIDAINDANCSVLLLIRPEAVESFKAQAISAKSVLLLEADYNDTWVRDYGFLTLGDDEQRTPVEFTFNGWGNKFNATKDNAINQTILAPLLNKPIHAIDLVCEGGAFEIDASGHLLSTSLCLSNPERNGEMPMSAYQSQFQTELGATHVTIYEHGHLQGDDTDGHIDTLVRYTLDKGLVVQGCFNRPDDVHYQGLQQLLVEVAISHPGFTVYELPLAEVINDEGDRLPASYANFLICNDAVLCPIYQQPEDQLALDIIAKAYPEHRIVAVDCLSLVKQYGGLHCITMHVPTGLLKSDITEQFNRGVISL